MFDLYTWINIVSAFIVGFIWIALATYSADQFGSKVGGFIGGLPSTSVVAFLFIGLVQGVYTASKAASIFPLTYSFAMIFLAIFAWQSINKKFRFSLVTAFITWLILSSLVILLSFDSFVHALSFYLIILFVTYLVFEKVLNIPSLGKKTIKFSKKQTISRGLFGGFMIGFAVFMSKVGGPIFGGIFAAFPATFISTLIITNKSRGIQFARAISKSMFITASITMIVYAISVKYFYLLTGIIWGTIISFAITTLFAYFAWIFLQRKK